MKLLVLLFVCFGVSISEAQILGKLKGSGRLVANYDRLDGKVESREMSCNVAVNFEHTDSKVEMEYSVFECNPLGGWNDLPVSLKNQNGILMDAQGFEKGRVYADGRVVFAASSYRTMDYYDQKVDGFCRILSSRKKSLRLDTRIEYTFIKEGSGYRMIRKVVEDNWAYTSKRDFPQCPANLVLVKTQMRGEMAVSLK